MSYLDISSEMKKEINNIGWTNIKPISYLNFVFSLRKKEYTVWIEDKLVTWPKELYPITRVINKINTLYKEWEWFRFKKK